MLGQRTANYVSLVEAVLRIMSKEKVVCAQILWPALLFLPSMCISKCIHFESHKYVLQGFVIPAWHLCIVGSMRKFYELFLGHTLSFWEFGGSEYLQVL